MSESENPKTARTRVWCNGGDSRRRVKTMMRVGADSFASPWAQAISEQVTRKATPGLSVGGPGNGNQVAPPLGSSPSCCTSVKNNVTEQRCLVAIEPVILVLKRSLVISGSKLEQGVNRSKSGDEPYRVLVGHSSYS